ncbi:MAG TPA: hypothetical protein VM305_00035 [Candidatus Limnocylindrales bacterium]|nr:hypothetical protein [Candidatus Limnocylindrales bacterium]
MVARGRRAEADPERPLLPPDEGNALASANSPAETYEREDLLKAYLGSLCGSVTEHARKLPRGVSTDLSKALSLLVADDLSRLLGKRVYRRVPKPKRDDYLDRESHRAAMEAWRAEHLGRAMSLAELWVGEIEITGGIKPQQLDIVVASGRDGLALAIDVKGLNTRENAGKNLKNRLGDFVSIAVNFHLRFPYSVLGGVLALPSDISEAQLRKGIRIAEGLAGRVSPSEGPERFEGFCLLVFDCDRLDLSEQWPSPGSPVRYDNFVRSLAEAYERRFGD